MINEIIQYTNKYIQVIERNFSWERDCRYIQKRIYGFATASYIFGAIEGNHTNVTQLSSADGSEI